MDTPATYGAPRRAAQRGGQADDGWGPATAVHSAAAAHAAQRHPGQTAAAAPPPAAPRQARHDGGWSTGYARPRIRERAAAQPWQRAGALRAAPGRGLPGWGAIVVLLVIAGIGGIIDTAGGTQSRGGFNIGIIVASVVAILVVRRSSMFPVVVAPPIVYAAASGGMLYLRSSGLHDHKVLLDAAANWLVYGFPAMAAATAAVLIIAGIRLIAHK